MWVVLSYNFLFKNFRIVIGYNNEIFLLECFLIDKDMYFNRIYRYMIIRIINCYRDINRIDYYVICMLYFKDFLYFIN